MTHSNVFGTAVASLVIGAVAILMLDHALLKHRAKDLPIDQMVQETALQYSAAERGIDLVIACQNKGGIEETGQCIRTVAPQVNEAMVGLAMATIASTYLEKRPDDSAVRDVTIDLIERIKSDPFNERQFPSLSQENLSKMSEAFHKSLIASRFGFKKFNVLTDAKPIIEVMNHIESQIRVENSSKKSDVASKN